MSNKKEKIMEAYIQLLDENPSKRVTVNSIVARCGVSRNTFYYYFPDIPSLIEELEAKWVGLIDDGSGEMTTIVDCLRPLAKYAEEHRSGLLHAYQNANVQHFCASMDRLWNAIVRRYLQLNGGTQRSDEERETVTRLFKGIFIGMTVNWLDAEMSYDLLEEGRRASEILHSEDLVRKLFALA